MDFVADSLVFMKKGSYVCVRFCCTDWLGNSSIIIEIRVSFVLSNGGPRLRVALESRWITKDRSPQILYSRSFVVLFCTAKLFCIFGPPSSGPKCFDGLTSKNWGDTSWDSIWTGMRIFVFFNKLTLNLLSCILFVVVLSCSFIAWKNQSARHCKNSRNSLLLMPPWRAFGRPLLAANNFSFSHRG